MLFRSNVLQDANDAKLRKFEDKAFEDSKKPPKFAKGGSASARADGCAQRGKTKGRMV